MCFKLSILTIIVNNHKTHVKDPDEFFPAFVQLFIFFLNFLDWTVIQMLNRSARYSLKVGLLPLHYHEDLKLYQKCDVKNGEDRFAQGTGRISPVKSKPRTVKLLHKHQPGLTGRPGWMTGPEHRPHGQQSAAGYQPKWGQRRVDPHGADSRCPRWTVYWQAVREHRKGRKKCGIMQHFNTLQPK